MAMGSVNSPPYTVSAKAINLIAEIVELTAHPAMKRMDHMPKMNRVNRIKTIYSSLAIENNPLSLDQVTDIINGRRILGDSRDIREVKNAYCCYEHLFDYNPYSSADLLSAHSMMMDSLMDDAGHYRSTGVGVFAGKELIHMAPPADLVPGHIDNLLKWLESSDDHPLIKSCVFHYEFEFIHPFSDGNGRTGRLWQTVILSNWKPIFQWVPVESLVYSNRDSYYKAIGDSTDLADSSPFIDLMLTMIRDAMLTVVDRSMVCETGDDGLTQGHRMILELIDSGKLTSIRDACTTLDFTESAVRRYLDELKEMGLIRRVGSRKAGHWERV